MSTEQDLEGIAIKVDCLKTGTCGYCLWYLTAKGVHAEVEVPKLKFGNGVLIVSNEAAHRNNRAVDSPSAV